jgi:hypothetical protein
MGALTQALGEMVVGQQAEMQTMLASLAQAFNPQSQEQ